MANSFLNICRQLSHPLELECKRFKSDGQFDTKELSDTSDDQETFDRIVYFYL